MPDRRNFNRHRKRLSLRFGADEISRLAFTEDISLEGLFIKAANVISPGGQIKIVLDLPEGQVKLDGRVMWAKRVPPGFLHKATRAGMGVKIISFLEGEAVYRNFCEALAAR